MMASAEGHLRINNDLIRVFGFILMEGRPNITLIINYNWTTITFPNLVPVLVFQFIFFIEIVIPYCFDMQSRLKRIDIHDGSLNISNKTLVLILKGVKIKICEF